MAQQYIGTIRLGTTQNVAYTGTAGTVANAFGTGVTKIRVMSTTDCFIAISKSPTAATTDTYLPSGAPEYFTVASGEKVSAVQVSSGGTLYVTEAV